MKGFGTLRKVGRAIKEVPLLLSPNKRKAKRQKLYEIIEAANLVEQFFESEVWSKVIYPYLKKQMDASVNQSMNHQKRFAEDVSKFTQIGAFEALSGLIEKLQSILNQKPNAEQDLELLGRSEKEETE